MIEDEQRSRVGTLDGGHQTYGFDRMGGCHDSLRSPCAGSVADVIDRVYDHPLLLALGDKRSVFASVDDPSLDEDLENPAGSNRGGNGVEAFEAIPDASGRHRGRLRR